MSEQLQNVDELDEGKIAEEKTKAATDKTCPNCGAVIAFDPAVGKLSCEYCGFTKEIEKETEEDETAAKEQKLTTAAGAGSSDWGTELKAVVCKSCGAKSTYDAHTVADACPYCGSVQVMQEKGEDTLAPGGLVPFKISQEKASELFREWLKSLWFCPGEVKKHARTDEFKGVYIPFWTFDSTLRATYTCRVGRHYETTNSKGETVTKTKWTDYSGHYKKFYNDYPVIASRRYDDNMIKEILPFDTEHNVKYKPEYLAGFAAERYTVGPEDAWKRAKSGILSQAKSEISTSVRSSQNADSISNINLKPNFTEAEYKYLLLPVWMSSFRNGGKVYRFMVNGETGKLSGERPYSVWLYVLIAFAVLAFLTVVIIL